MGSGASTRKSAGLLALLLLGCPGGESASGPAATPSPKSSAKAPVAPEIEAAEPAIPTASAEATPSKEAAPAEVTPTEVASDAPETAEPSEPAASTPVKPPAAPPPTCDTPCEPKTLAVAKYPHSLLADETHAYYVSQDQLWSVPLEGGAPRVLAEEIDAAAVQSKDAIYACREARGLNKLILRIPKAGDPPTEMAVTAKCELAISDDQLYFIQREDWANEWLSRAPLLGGPAERLHRLNVSPNQLAADDRFVVWDQPRSLHRFELRTKTVKTIVEDFSALHVELLGDHVYWLEDDELWRMPHAGGARKVVANFIESMEFSVSGSSILWGEDEGWTRFDPRSLAGRRLTTDGSTGPTVAVGSRVLWLSRADKGALRSLETCGCDGATYPSVLGVKPIEAPPLDERQVYGWTFASKGVMHVSINDFSDDEYTALARAIRQHSGRIALDTPNLPPRFSDPATFWVAADEGVFEARSTGFWIWSSDDDGLQLDLMLEAPELDRGSALVVFPGGPKPSALQTPKPSKAAVATYLPAAQAFVDRELEVTLKASNLRVFPAKLPAPHAAIIEIHLPKQAQHALLLGDAAGTITAEIEPLRAPTQSLSGLVDIDGDGVMEFVYDTEYDEDEDEDESGEPMLVTWEGSKPSFTALQDG
ncbi:MAG: hypothetical protein AAF799_39665 [Myxococcota bacterium]